MIEQTTRSDAELLGNFIRTSDGKAMDELIGRYGKMVFRTGYRVLNDVHEAEDVTQAAFIVLVSKAASLRAECNLPAYLHGVARRVALNSLRSRVRRKKKEEQSMDFIQSKSQDETGGLEEVLHRNLDMELEKLSAIQRQAVILRYMEGHNEKEAAKIAGCSISAMSSRAFEGLAVLKKRLSHVNPALGAALIPLMDAESKIEISAALLSSVKAAVLSAKVGTLAAGGSNAQILAKGVLKMMFWRKVKIVAATIAATAVVPSAIIIAQNMKTPEKASGERGKIVSTQAEATTQKTTVPDSQGTDANTVPTENPGNSKTTGVATADETVVRKKMLPEQIKISHQVQCIFNLRQIGIAVAMYSMKHNGYFPAGDGAKGLEELRAGEYLNDTKNYTCPSTSDSIPENSEITDDNCSYGFRGGLTQSSPAYTPLAWDKPRNHKECGDIVFVDCHVQGFSGEEWLKMQRKWKLE